MYSWNKEYTQKWQTNCLFCHDFILLRENQQIHFPKLDYFLWLFLFILLKDEHSHRVYKTKSITWHTVQNVYKHIVPYNLLLGIYFTMMRSTTNAYYAKHSFSNFTYRVILSSVMGEWCFLLGVDGTSLVYM